jgi:hypothetical protein
MCVKLLHLDSPQKKTLTSIVTLSAYELLMMNDIHKELYIVLQ